MIEPYRPLTPIRGNYITASVKTWNDDLTRRTHFIETFAWAYPTREAISSIVAFAGNREIVEVGAGYGFWATLLTYAGAKIHATDSYDWYGDYRPLLWRDLGVRVEKRGYATAIRNANATGCDALFMCWPPYDHDMAVKALRAFHGNRFIYIGEGPGGCNATDAFFDLLDNEYKEIATIQIPQFAGIHDRVKLYARFTPQTRHERNP